MRKIVLLLVGVFAICMQLLAQTRTVTGRVTDAQGLPVPNASVLVRGTNQGTVTSEDGNFTLNVPTSARVLVVSAVGQAQQEITLGTQTNLNIVLQTQESSLQEVVVIGYGTQRRRAVTSSISRVSGEEIANLPVPSFDKALAGQASGVNVTLGSGIVNATPRIRIRGVNSLTSGRDPLFVIDGVPTFSSGFSGVANTNPMSDINPNDIESIEILKDGAATAIYGSSAANGVILITTKKGRAGRSQVNYDTYFGSSSAFRKPELLNAQEFVTIANEKLVNANLAPAAFMNTEGTNTDWLAQVFRERAAVQSHSVSMSGGTDKTTFYVSLNYMKQQGIVFTNVAERVGARANVEHRANRFFRIGNNITLSRTEDNDQNNGGNALSGAMGAALRALPNVRVMNPNHPTGYNITAANDALGADSNRRNIENNYSNIKYVLDKNQFNSDKYRIINNAFIEVTPVEGLSIRSQGAVDYQTGTDFQALDPIHGDGRSAGGNVFNQSLQRMRLVWQNYFNYTTLIANNHNVSLTGGVEIQKDRSHFFSASGSGISDVFFASNSIITNTYANQFSGGSYGESGFQSFFGRVSYDFRNKYFFQASIRRDGLSSLAPERRYGTFPGVSAGWRISEEDFWKNSALNSTINEVKLRGSYAVVGNPLGGFPYLSTYGAAPYGAVSGIAINLVGNPELQWETNKKISIGADIGLLNNRFNFVVDYFRNNNDDLVLRAPTPPSVGIPGNRISKNIGSMVNKGWEFSLNGDALRQRDFTWNFNINFTTQQNQVTSLVGDSKEQILPGPNNGTFNILRVGEPINGIYGYNYAGVNSANGNPMWVKADGSLVQYNVVPGAAAGYYLVIKPGDATLGAPSSLTGADRAIIGSPLPKWFGGFSNTFSYKGFGLDFLLRFQGGNEVYNLTRQEVLNSQGFVNNGKEILNRWTPTNQNTNVPKLYYGRDNQINLQGQANSRFLESGDFIRLQNVTLFYNLGRNMLSTATNDFIKTARIFVQGQNLAVWTKYSGIDPENTSELGIDNSSVPQLRSFTAGLNIGF
ncbi:MAG: SusC/RagA family TonB-linked outer membrane protein [Chitinophagaceae bacterium]